MNCTFDNNTKIFDSDETSAKIAITNCIFSNNTTTFPSNTVRGRTTYSLTDESITGYGVGCDSANPTYSITGTTLRSAPADWRPKPTSPARNMGVSTVTGADSLDISGALRIQDSTGKRDAGCWDIFDTVQPPVITKTLSDTAIGIGKPLVVKLAVTGTAPLSYSWRKVGSATPVSLVDSFTITAAALTDDNAQYFCVVKNSRDSATSNTFRLHVVAMPVISGQPRDTSVYLGDTASFSIAASGENITYAWKRGAAAIAGATAASYKFATVAGDSGAVFTCTVTNLAGSVVSNQGLLRVLPHTPKIVGRTADTTVMESQSVTLRVVAQGKPIITYAWYKMGDTTLRSVADSLPLSYLAPVDSVRYRCIVANATGKDSVSIKLTVTQGALPKITSQPLTSLTALAGENVVMAVTANGTTPLTYTWYKDAISASGIATGSSHTITGVAAKDTGAYYCVVENVFGRDTTEAIVLSLRTIPQYNPLTIQAAFVDPTRAKITVKNFLALPFTSGAAPYVDSVGIWFGTVTFPAAPLSRAATSLVKLPLALMRAGGVDSYDTVVQFFASAPDECGSLYMAVSPLWRSPDTVLSAVSTMQRATVAMCATMPLANKLVLDVAYERVSDSIVVSIGNLTSLNRDSLMYIVVEYGAGTGTFRADSTDRILKASLPAATENLLRKTFKDARFAGLEDSLTVRISWRGILGNSSVPVEKKIGIGRLRPVNTAVFSIDSAGATSLYCAWTFPVAPDVDSIRIWWGRQPVPLAADFDTALFDFVTLPKTALTTTVTGLQTGNFYGAGLQVGKEGVWSVVTAASRDTATTRSPHVASIPNTIKNVTARFDTTRNTIAVSWDLDTTGIGPLSNLSAGIAWSVGAAPLGTSVTAGQSGKIITPLKIAGDTATIDPGSTLNFESTYHIAMLLRRKEDVNWASATAASRATVVIPKPKWQLVTYFSGSDTVVTALNQQVVIKKAGSGTVSVTDTLRIFTPATAPRGFVVVGRYGVDFAKDVKSDPVIFGMRYDTTLLGNLAAGNIRMYQFNADSGWRIVDGSVVDIVQKMVTIRKHNGLSADPFMLMIDTVRPVVTIVSDTSATVQPNRPITDTFTIADNISNSSARFYYWRVAGQETTDAPSARCSGETSTVYLTVPADSISTVRGLRTLLTVSDGCFTDTIDVSRVVSRSRSDDVVLQKNIWTPVRTTTALADSSIETALDELKVDGKWLYDSIRFRMFRWIDTARQAAASDPLDTTNWVEYRAANRELFSMVPGRVLWVKAYKQVAITSLGEGTTVSLKHPCAIRLRANDWTDIALPYNFDVTIGDIMQATSSDTAVTNKIKIYKWNFDPDSGIAFAAPKYDAEVPGLDSGASALAFRPSGGESVGTYTVFNKNIVDVNLLIPALPTGYSTFVPASPAAAKRKKTAGWCVAVSGRSPSGAVSPVYCAFRAGKGVTALPVPPGFGKQRVAVIDARQSAVCGSIVFHEAPEGGCVFPLVFTNKAARPAEMSYRVSVVESLPESYRIGLYNPERKSVEPMTDFTERNVPVAANAEERRWLIVGDSSFIAAWSKTASVDLSLLRIFPNPCRGDVRLQFTLPYNDVREVRIALFNQLGQRVWDDKLSGRSLRYGSNSVMLRLSTAGKLGSGTYLVSLTTVNGKGVVTAMRRQRILYMP